MRIFLASHGKMASGIKSSVDILLGNSQQLTVYDAFLDNTNINDILDEYFSHIDQQETVILLSDLYGGSVNQMMSLYLGRPHTMLVAGVNLALVLELALKTDTVSETDIEQIINQSKESIRLVKLDQVKLNDEEFF